LQNDKISKKLWIDNSLILRRPVKKKTFLWPSFFSGGAKFSKNF